MSMVSITDSYFSYVARRLQAMNAQVVINGVSMAQPVGGMIDARDWPQTRIVEGALYLLLQRVVPTGRSKVEQQYCFYCQWSWILIGTNTAAGQQGTNRGDRYRQSLQIMRNLANACYPGFCQKMIYAMNGSGIEAVPSQTVNPVSATEMILWTEPKFVPRVDAALSGVEYGAATVEISAYEEMTADAGMSMSDVTGAQLVV